MIHSSRRRFVATALGLPLAMRGLKRLSAAELSGGPRVVALDLESKQDWIRVGNRDAYLYAFNGSVPGPVIEAWPGDRLEIRFRNGLAEPTNVHYHGLHAPPTGNADNVMLSIPPGESFAYELDLPATHPGGTFWYHPHLHGLAAQQVSRGLAGVLIVRGDLDRIPEISAAPEQILVLQDFDLDIGGVPAEPAIMDRMVGREGSLITVNGSLNPTVPIQRSGWVRLRILNASSSRCYRLALEDHPLYVIATDGGALPAPEERNEILLAPGERAEIMVHAARPDGRYRLIDLPYRRVAGMAETGSTAIATLTYEGVADFTWSLPQRLIEVDPLPTPAVRRRFLLGSGMGMGGMMGGMALTINGRTFNPNRVDTRVALNAVEDWEFVNRSAMDHPMHIHTNPFQLIGSDNTPIRAWKDVVLVPALSRVTVRTQFRDFTGRTMYHCHILDHEDLGMMGVLEVLTE